MLTKRQKVFIKQLQHKKGRVREQCFVVTGQKAVFTFLSGGVEPLYIVVTPHFLAAHPDLGMRYKKVLHTLSADALTRLSTLKSQKEILLVVPSTPNLLPLPSPHERLLLVDAMRDPGNLGTLLRIADWYGIQHLIASPTTVDCYNPKVVQASMGSLMHVQVHYTPLIPFVQRAKAQQIPVIGAVLDGSSLYGLKWPKAGCLVIGSETHGISAPLRQEITLPITIPRIGQAESLNAAVATGIICDHWQQGIATL